MNLDWVVEGFQFTMLNMYMHIASFSSDPLL